MRVRGGRGMADGAVAGADACDKKSQDNKSGKWGLVDRVGSVLSLDNGGKFDAMIDEGGGGGGSASAGQVCAIVGLKNITTGDTLTDASVHMVYYGGDGEKVSERGSARNGYRQMATSTTILTHSSFGSLGSFRSVLASLKMRLASLGVGQATRFVQERTNSNRPLAVSAGAGVQSEA